MVADDVAEDYAAVDWTVPSADEWERVQAELSQRRVSVPTPDPDGGWV
jgi:hypothetical protein